MRFTIRDRFRYLLVGCVLFIGSLAVVAFSTRQSVLSDVSTLSNDAFPSLLEVQQFLDAFERIELSDEEIILTGEMALLEPRAAEVEGLRASLLAYADRTGATPRTTQILTDFETYNEATVLAIHRILGAEDPVDVSPERATMDLTTLTTFAQEHRQAVDSGFRSLEEDHRERVASSMGAVRQSLAFQGTVFIVSAVLAVIGLLVWLLTTSRRIMIPLDALARAADAVSRGDLQGKYEIPVLGNDEMADLTEAFHAMTRGLRESTVSKEYLDRVLESMADSVVVCDSDLRIRSVNAAGERLLSLPAAELIGTPFASLVAESDRGTFDRCIGILGVSDWLDGTEVSVVRPDGSEVSVRLAGAVLRESDDSVGGYVLSGADISEWKRVERELREAKLAAEEGTRAKSAFLATMSHEIRTPMTAVLGFAENLLDPDLTDEAREDAVRTIQSNGQHLVELINSILDLSKIEAGRLEVERLPVAPAVILESCCDLMAVPARAKGLEIDLAYVNDLPGTIQSDPTRLRQVLLNLIGNAVKFTESGTVQVRAYLHDGRGPRGGPLLDILIKDSGIGMTREQIAAVFSPFTQADGSMARRFGGTGLGLTISRQLARLLGGDISADSVPGKGSTFRATFATGPLDGVPRPRPEVLRRIAQAGETKVGQPALRDLDAWILIADDNPVNLRLISHIVNKAGAAIETVVDGQQAVDRALRAAKDGHPFDVILMDVQMPVLDGIGATRTLRKNGYLRPIIALTANAMVSDRLACMQAGCSDFATKPIDRADLLRKLAAAIRSARSMDATSASAEKTTSE